MSDARFPSELWVGGEVKRGQTTLVPSTVISAKASVINNETYNEIHSYIYESISTYRPTLFVNSIRESKDHMYGLIDGKLSKHVLS